MRHERMCHPNGRAGSVDEIAQARDSKEYGGGWRGNTPRRRPPYRRRDFSRKNSGVPMTRIDSTLSSPVSVGEDEASNLTGPNAIDAFMSNCDNGAPVPCAA